MSLIKSIESEQAVIGAILYENDVLASILPILHPEHFSDPVNKRIFKAIIELDDNGEAIDPFTIDAKLGDNYGSYLGDLSMLNTSPRAAETYARTVAEKAKYRKLASIGDSIRDMMQDEATSEEVEEFIGKQLLEASEGEANKTQLSMGAAIKMLIERTDDRFNDRVELYSTGFTDVDSVLRLEPGRMMVIAGRPGTGKSTFAQNILEHNAKNGIPCYMATMEMGWDEVASRVIASQANVDSKFLQDPSGYSKTHKNTVEQQFTGLGAGASLAKDWPFMIDYCPGLTLAAFKRRTRAYFNSQKEYRENKKGIMCIDYLGLMRMEGDNRVQGLGAITKALKTFAGEMGLPLLLLAQLNRGVEQRPNKRPMNSDLRDSGEIEEDADIIAFLYRDELYNEDTVDRGIAEIILGKNRGGNPCTVRLAAKLQHYKFDNLNTGY